MPTKLPTEKPTNGIERLAAIFKSVDWVVPAYIPLGALSYYAATIERAPDLHKQAVLETALRAIYDERHFASFLLGLYQHTRQVRAFKAQIEEAITAWFIGLHHAAVATMVPVLEGVIRKIAQESKREVGNGTKKVIAELDELISKEDRSPHSTVITLMPLRIGVTTKCVMILCRFSYACRPR
jgi:hypothetical protein